MRKRQRGERRSRRRTPCLPLSLSAKAARYFDANWTPQTAQAYERCFARFRTWCAERGQCSLPATVDTVRQYLLHLDQQRVDQMARHRTAIAHYHWRHSHPLESAPLTAVIQKARMARIEPIRQAYPIDIELLRAVVARLPRSLIGLRDKAMFLVGFAAALRPGELVSLDLHACVRGRGVIRFVPGGLLIDLHQSKSDQRHRGYQKLIVADHDPCPVQALAAWLAASGVSKGPIFRRVTRWGAVREQSVTVSWLGLRLRLAVAEILSAQEAALVSGMSLRAGFVCSAVAAGADRTAIIDHVGWAGHGMLMRYARLSKSAGLRITRDLLGAATKSGIRR